MKNSFAPEMQVKQYVAVVRNSRGIRFRVFKTGSEKHYLFDPMIPGTDGSACAGFPVLKKNLRDDIRKALAHGYGNSD